MGESRPHESPEADTATPDAGVLEAIRYADSLLPGVPASEFQKDDRWLAILQVANYAGTLSRCFSSSWWVWLR
jgi:hypothetical protein